MLGFYIGIYKSHIFDMRVNAKMVKGSREPNGRKKSEKREGRGYGGNLLKYNISTRKFRRISRKHTLDILDHKSLNNYP